jgi:transcriptional regulatory protein LevR/transcriptional regulator with AAA-type ATPase domain
MRRIDLVLIKLKELKDSNPNGASAIDIAQMLNLDRANVSKDLNKLATQEKVIKTKGKPTLFKINDGYNKNQTNNGESKEIKEHNVNDTSIMDIFLEKNPSLYVAVEQAKAAILYPPNGMNILLLGETGVGKSTFAGLIYKYAIEMKVKSKNSPFITFNCADYANNPQLLLGQIFGVKKGAYTGADLDKAGLIEKSDGGILFLDEVHRLPAEGQEMFFTFMDKGVYRRLGETDSERSASVLIITATTEDPNTTLLKTFTRRIPMVITIPALKDRGMEERFNLIKQFMIEESGRLGKSIKVSINSIKAFLSYNCENNVGQLKSDIQLACAKAYADYLSNRKDDIKINSVDLLSYIREGLYKEIEHRQLWNKLIDINKRYCIFDKNEEKIIFEENTTDENIYEMLDLRTRELKSRGIRGIELEEEMEKNIEDYFKKYMNKVYGKIDTTNLNNIVDKDIMEVIEDVIEFCEDQLKRKLDKKIYYGLAVHINNSIDRIRRNKKISNPKLNSIRKEYENEFEIALNAIKIIDRDIDIHMPIDEAGFITMFLIYDDQNIKVVRSDVKIIIIAHGVSTATSMADAVNSLLGSKYAIGINAPIEERPKNILEKVKEYIRENQIKTDILFLVDMGSLTTFGKEVENEFRIKTRTVPLACTLHAIEATRKAIIGYSLDEIYKETLEVNNLYDNNVLDYEPEESEEKKLAIITICTTGEGGAKTIKTLIEDSVKFDHNFIEIVPLNFIGKENIYDRIEKIKKAYDILCFVGPFELDLDYPQFMLDDIIEGNCIDNIQKLIDIEKTYVKMQETLENKLKNVDGKAVLKDVKRFSKTVSEALNIKITTNVLIGIALHMSCMIDRLLEGKNIDDFQGKDTYIKENLNLYRIIKSACTSLNTKYSIIISDEEICCLMNFFNPKVYLKNNPHK